MNCFLRTVFSFLSLAFLTLCLEVPVHSSVEDELFGPDSTVKTGNQSSVNARKDQKKEKTPKKEEIKEPVKRTPVPSSRPLPPMEITNQIDAVLPAGAIAMLRTAPVSRVNDQGKFLLAQLGLGSFAPLDWLKWTPYGKSLNFLDLNRGLGSAFYENNGQVFSHLLAVPVKNFRSFVLALGAKSGKVPDPVPEKYLIELSVPKGSFCWLNKGYAIIIDSSLKDRSSMLLSAPSIASTEREGAPGIGDPLLSVEVFQRGIANLDLLRKAISDNYSNLFSNTVNTMGVPLPDPEVRTQLLSKLDLNLQWIERDLAYLRLDMNVRDKASIWSISCIPHQNSSMMAQIQDRSRADMPIDMMYQRFLKIVPEYSAPIAGQIDMSPTAAASLEPPFNRLRHIEYSLSLPPEGELLADSWCFFLEVDDAEAFLYELTVPKAQKIGSFEGSEKLGELGARILGNIAVRRQNRQAGRRFPRSTADPQSAAERGQELGARLGDAIGRSIAEKQVMKTYDFEGYPLRISDLEMYTRKMREIRAKESGQLPRNPVVLNGERTLMMLISNIMSGLESASLDGMVANAFQKFAGAGQMENIPLLARKNLYLTLDPKHLLIVPGNENILREAKNNWPFAADHYLRGDSNAIDARPNSVHISTADISWDQMWNEILADIPDINQHQLRSVTRIDPESIKQLIQIARAEYLPGIPRNIMDQIPYGTPRTFIISTTTDFSAQFYHAIPHKTSAAFLKSWLEMNQKKTEQKK
ncbi:MAG: hypothetical protein Q4G69_07575 [Planctomycetia bacterium]|nr:hypothetical protein [Planctomycetia bacterium]